MAPRFVLVPSLHPDWTLLLFFFHSHSTVTATLALIFIPKVRSSPICMRLTLVPCKGIVDLLSLQHPLQVRERMTEDSGSE
jgi:hypothetical protein